MANENGQIQSFPYLLINPRRTKDKPTTEEQEEWLVQYDPVLPDDAHRVLSHNYHVRYAPSPANHLGQPFLCVAGCEHKTHINCASLAGIHLARLCVWARPFRDACRAVGSIRCVERDLQQGSACFHHRWTSRSDYSHAADGTKEAPAREMVSIGTQKRLANLDLP